MPDIPATTGWRKARNEAIGAGGQANVYAVEPIDATRVPPGQYAMKMLRNMRSSHALSRFQREAEALKRVSDARIAEVVDHHHEGADCLFYVMPDYLEAGYLPLGEIVHAPESPFLAEARRALYFIAECADALEACHNASVVHRDLKPANILYHPATFKPIILDFGCCYMEGGAALTLVDEGVGSQNYMAPECETGAAGEPGAGADLYSLGKILWVLLTGRRPFARERPAFADSNLNKVLPRSEECWHATRVLLRSVRRDPASRYPKAADMASHCRQLANDVIGRYPPLERVKTVCPACGQGELVAKNPKFPVPMHGVFGNPMPQGVAGYSCDTCGVLIPRDNRVLTAYFRELGTAE